MQNNTPIMKDLVLLGGGHAHVAVLKAFGMRPFEGVRVTLVSRDPDTPYSGMLPGLVAGHYTVEEAHIDLGRLARFAGARFLRDEAIGLDPSRKQILFHDRPPLSWDLLSIDTGSTPHIGDVAGAARCVTPVKPIDGFLKRWRRLCARAVQNAGPLRIAVVGAGAGGVELLLAAQHRLRALRREAGIDAPVRFDLYASSLQILPEFPEKVRSVFTRTLKERGAGVHCGAKVARVTAHELVLENGEIHRADEILWVTDAAAPDWFARGGLATDARGFIRVNACLQSVSHPDVFAAGDIAAVDPHPRPKAGVFAVRQGPPLIGNLRRALAGRALAPFRPQRDFLKLISTGDKYAVGVRNGYVVKGHIVWRWKDWIDRRFMRRFNDLPPMQPGRRRRPAGKLAALTQAAGEDMRCGGCGAKVGADSLASALGELRPLTRPEVIAGLDAPDDAAIVRPPDGQVLVHTVDSFRAMIEDPYLFGQIAANHALNDIFAMGGEPRTALAIAALPYAAPDKTAADLRHMMAGAVRALNGAGVALVGGHSAEAAEASLGFAVNGVVDEARILRKSGLRPGDRIVLTKPLGTGALLAADMRWRAKSCWIAAAIAAMLQGNADAARLLIEAGARAATDVTGFGLAGHLGEMAQASGVRIVLDPAALPLLDGAAEVLTLGMRSTLHPQNAESAARLFGPHEGDAPRRFPILADPQTSGGLLAGLPADRADACLAALRAAGYASAAIIGEVAPEQPDGAWLTLKAVGREQQG